MAPSLAFLLLLASTVTALYPFGPQIDQLLPRGDEVFVEVTLNVPIKFYGQPHQTIFVNTNGLLSFLTGTPRFYNEPFPLEYPVVAPLYSNVDTSGSGNVFYRESRESDVLTTIAKKIAALYPSLPAFVPLAAFIVTWQNVGYYDRKNDKVNTFQAVISSDGSESFVELLYPENGVTWIRGESPSSSLPDAIAQAGLSAPGGKLAALKGSGTDRVYNLPRWSNTLSPGEYMFRVGNIEDTGQPEPPQRSINSEDEELIEPQSCSDGGLYCHKLSECIDQPEGGFCCRCLPGYFGDGKNCLNFDSHRMLGKLNISINGVEGRDLNMQAFIVTNDGRTYTAISGIPQVVGYDMQLLISLGSFVGFLFAKPLNNAPNGYQLTGGVVNHTIDLTFDTHHHIHIKQRYTGLDLFEQVKMEAEVVGTLPSVPPGTKLNVLDFKEHFTRIGQGQFRSQSKHIFEVDGTSERHEVSVDQTIQFDEYCPAYKNIASLRLKVSRHYLSFEEKDSILRLASTNKISQNEEGQDPCIEGHVTCVANSTCLVEDDSFRCVCNQGFQTLQDECLDINECEDGTANCHQRALCVNEVGSYSCQCLPGYTGNGRYCQALEAPSIPNAVCRQHESQQICECHSGFEKVEDGSELGFRCVDIDECETQLCGSNSVCYNFEGGFQCECSSGFQRIGLNCVQEGGCENVECPEGSECRESEAGPHCYRVEPPPYQPSQPSQPLPPEGGCENVECPEGSECRESEAGPDCYRIEPPPYQPSQPSQQVSPEECSDDRDCRQNFECTYNETYDSNICTCRADYVLEGTSCIPPTSNNVFVRTCVKGECWCPPGYVDNGELCVLSSTIPTTHSPPQRTCRELNNCDRNAQCIYVSGRRDYECKCNAGFEGDGYTCAELEISCNISPICDINAECRLDPSSNRHICICNDGYQGDGTTCFPSEEQCPVPCHPDGLCVAGQCMCMDGFVGDGITCEKGIPDCYSLQNCHADADCIYNSQEESYQCTCRQGFEGDGYTCNKIITCHEIPSLCSPFANCIYNSPTYECKCTDGYYGNGSHCKVINRQAEEFLLLNKGRSTLRLPFNPTGTNIGQPIQMHRDQHTIGIAIDCIEGRVYWSDIMNQKIKSSFYNGSDVQDFIVSGVKSPEGLTIDWINRVLYWTDSGNQVIASANLDDKQIKNIVTTGLSNPRGIAVDPHRGKLYWSDWNRKDPIIESSDLDGGNREVLIQKPNVMLPNSLAIDWDLNEICWADAGLKRIECYNIYQRVTRTVVQDSFYPFGLAITSDAYFWTDWYTGKVESSTKGSGVLTKSIPLPIGGDDKLYGLVAVTSSCPRGQYN